MGMVKFLIINMFLISATCMLNYIIAQNSRCKCNKYIWNDKFFPNIYVIFICCFVVHLMKNN